MKLPTSMCSGADPPLAAVQLAHALDAEHVRVDAVDAGAERAEEAAEILDVRLAGGVPEHGRPGRQHGGHDGVLGRHHARLVEEDRRPAQAVGAHVVAAVQPHLGAELGERVDVRVEAPAADHVAARRRHARAAEARQQRPGEQERGADAAAQLRVELGLVRAGRSRRAPRSRPSHSTSAPTSSSSSTIVSTSRMRGTFVSVTGSEASSVAARIGSAPFLFPAARTRPVSGRPPSMTNVSANGLDDGAHGARYVTHCRGGHPRHAPGTR